MGIQTDVNKQNWNKKNYKKIKTFFSAIFCKKI